jgi:diguanylate cyclase (GGDEF)-like protein
MFLIFVLLLGLFVGFIIGFLVDRLAPSARTAPAQADKMIASTSAAAAEKIVAGVAAGLREISLKTMKGIDSHSQLLFSMESELGSMSTNHLAELSIIARLINANGTLQGQLQEAQSRLRDQTAQLSFEKEEARTDELTGLRNRRALRDELELRHRESQIHRQSAGVMMLDLDNFKQLNDTFGHAAGDEVLRAVGKVLQTTAQAQQRLFPARYGGEEFAVVYHGYTVQEAGEIADQLRIKLSELRINYGNKLLHIRASVGVAEFYAGPDIKQTLVWADEALYTAKRTGRNKTVVHQPPKTILPQPSSEYAKKNEVGGAIELLATAPKPPDRRTATMSATLPIFANQEQQRAG